MSEESIELPITKPKRAYTKRTKIVIDVPAIMAEHVSPTVELVKEPFLADLSLMKPRRTYVRKPKESVPPFVEPTPICDPPTLLRTETVVFDTPPTSPIPPKEKKPRTEKQLAAFQKMRDARASKQNELNDLKELEKTQRQLENEQRKLDTVTEKVLAKATELKTKRVSKKKASVVDDGYRTEPESIIQETKHKQIIFV
jgi:hypothetical protein